MPAVILQSLDHTLSQYWIIVGESLKVLHKLFFNDLQQPKNGKKKA
jgi:hypothetical protein